MPRDELAKPLLGQPAGGRLGGEVALTDPGRAHVREQEAEDVVREQDGRHEDALLPDPVEPAGIDPGGIPPTSEWWAREQANATTSPSTESGETMVTSGRCVPPENGSLRMNMSPGRGSRSITAATETGIAPRCTGMCSACATMRPSASNSAGRAVAALLDVRREGAADEHDAHLLRDTGEGAVITESVTGSSISVAPG